MPNLTYGRLFIIAILICLGIALSSFLDRDTNNPVLPQALSSVICSEPAKDEYHANHNKALTQFSGYAFYDVCIPQKLVREKHMLKCGSRHTEDICDDTNIPERTFTKDKNGDIHAHISVYSEKILNPASSATFRFSQSGFQIHEDTIIKTALKKDQLSYPNKITPLTDVNCMAHNRYFNETSSFLFCRSYLRFKNVDIAMEVEFKGDIDGFIAPLKEDHEFWLSFLNEMIIEPQPE